MIYCFDVNTYAITSIPFTSLNLHFISFHEISTKIWKWKKTRQRVIAKILHQLLRIPCFTENMIISIRTGVSSIGYSSFSNVWHAGKNRHKIVGNKILYCIEFSMGWTIRHLHGNLYLTSSERHAFQPLEMEQEELKYSKQPI